MKVVKDIAERLALAFAVTIALLFGAGVYLMMIATILAIPAGIAWVLYALGVWLLRSTGAA